jgi:hypothetical protein
MPEPAGVCLSVDPEALAPLIERVVEATLRRLEDARAGPAR